jgi:hypothetical protein
VAGEGALTCSQQLVPKPSYRRMFRRVFWRTVEKSAAYKLLCSGAFGGGSEPAL